jgi:hypothetical protein
MYECKLCGFKTDDYRELVKHRPDAYSPCELKRLPSEQALLAIQESMDGVEWTPDTLERIAEILEQAGYRVRDTQND